MGNDDESLQQKSYARTIEDATEAEKSISTLMGDKSEPRKEYINEHANFNREDYFDKVVNG